MTPTPKERAQDSRLNLVRRFYHDMWNRFDTSVFPELIVPDFAFRGSLGCETTGWHEFASYVESIRAFAPEFRNEIERLIADSTGVFAKLRYTGVHRGEVFGIAPTGRAFEYGGAAVFDFAGDRIREVWVLGDVYGLIGQLGSC